MRRRSSVNSHRERIDDQQLQETGVCSDFGDEVEDQYYKTSVPGGLLISPKRSSDAQPLSMRSGSSEQRRQLGTDRDLERLKQEYHAGDGDSNLEDDLHFAPLSVEDDVDDADYAADQVDMLEFCRLEVESGVDGNLSNLQMDCDDSNQKAEGFNEADFKLFQKARLQEVSSDHSNQFASEKEDQILSLLDQEQQLYESQSNFNDDIDDYGIKIGSPQKPVQPSHAPFAQLAYQPNAAEIQSDADLRNLDPDTFDMLHSEDQAQLIDAEPYEIVGNEQSQDQSSQHAEQDVTQIQSLASILLRNSGKLNSKRQGGKTLMRSFQPPIQVKSFVRMEGSIPFSQSTKTKNGLSESRVENENGETGEKSTSLLQQTPPEASEDSAAKDDPQALAHLSLSQKAAVQVSQFTEQSKSGSNSTQRKQMRRLPETKFEFGRHERNEESGSARLATQQSYRKGTSSLVSEKGPPTINLNKLAKLGSPSVVNRLGATQSDLNRTRGAELALKDLLHSSPKRKSSQAASRNGLNSSNQAPQPLITRQALSSNSQFEKQSVARSQPRTISRLDQDQGAVVLTTSALRDCGPEGHDTPDSMHHYSQDETDKTKNRACEDSEEAREDSRILEHKMPADFKNTINSARSSIKPDDIRPSTIYNKNATASRAYLEEQDLGMHSSAKKATEAAGETQANFEFKTSINFQFRGTASDSEGSPKSKGSQQISDSSKRRSEEASDGESKTTQRIHTAQNLHCRAPLTAHEYEAVAIESTLANPTALKSHTSMGLPARNMKRRKNQCDQAHEAISETQQAPNFSRVDQKRKLDSKLSIVRRNAEKLKQKRKEQVYQQSSTVARTRSLHSSKGTVAMNSSTASTVPRPLNLSRFQTSQKVISKNTVKAPLPMSQIKNKNQNSRVAAQKQPTAAAKKPRPPQTSTQGRSETETSSKKVFQVSRASIPRQALNNAAKSIKQQNNSRKQSKVSQKLPSAMQKMLTAQKPQKGDLSVKAYGSHPLKDKEGCLSQTTFDYREYRQERLNDVQSAQSLKGKVLHVDSLHSVPQGLQTSIKNRAREEDQSSGREPVRFADMNNSSSQASFCNQTNAQSLNKLKQKYGKGSPRIYGDEPPKQIKLSNSPQGRGGRAKQSMASVFDRSQKTQVQKPPLSGVRLSAAEVKQQEKIQRQEQVLKVQLDKLESKLDRKRREISQGSRKSVPNSSSGPISLYGSVVVASGQMANQGKDSSSFAQRRSTNLSVTTKVRQPSQSEVQQPDSVAISISKYKKKRRESAAMKNLASRTASSYNRACPDSQKSVRIQVGQLGEDSQAPDVVIEEEKKVQALDSSLLSLERERSYNQDQSMYENDPQVERHQMGATSGRASRAADQSTKPVFESPKAMSINQQASGSNGSLQNQLSSAGFRAQEESKQDGAALISHRAVNGEDQDAATEELKVQSERLEDNSFPYRQESEAMTRPQVADAAGTKSCSVKSINMYASNADQKTGFESIHEAVATSKNESAVLSNSKSPGGYQSLRQKGSRQLKNGEKFESLRSYIEKTDKYRGLIEPSSMAQQKPGLLSDESPASPGEYKSSSMRQSKPSPNFSQVINSCHMETREDLHRKMDATFKPQSRQERVDDPSSASKKDQKSELYGFNQSPPRKHEMHSSRRNSLQQVTTPRMSLTPVLKDSSQAKRMRRESVRQSKGDYNRSQVSQEKSMPPLPTEATMFQAASQSNNREEQAQPQQMPPTFFMSNLFKKLSNEISRQKTSDISEIQSQISRPQSSACLAGLNRVLVNPTDHSMDISGLSQAPEQNQSVSRLSHKISAQKSAGQLGKKLMGQKPPRTCLKQPSGVSQETTSAKNGHNMTAVDFIEETKDYQRVIYDLNNLLTNPRQHKPLKASSTSDVSYLSHRSSLKKPGCSPTLPLRDRQKHSPPQKLSPRMRKNIKGQLLVSQKRRFNPNAMVSIGPKQRQNRTIIHDRATATIEAANDSMSYSHQSPERASTNSVVLGHGLSQGQTKRVGLTKHSTLEYPHRQLQLQQLRKASVSSLSLRSGVRMNNQSRVSNSIGGGAASTSMLAAMPMRNSRCDITAGAISMNTVHSNQTALSKAEKVRKQNFDKSLQREVEAIERVISHKQEQPHQPGPLKTQGQINEYVDSLRQRAEHVSIVNIEPASEHLMSAERSNSGASPVMRTATLSRQDRSEEMQVITVGSSALRPREVSPPEKEATETRVNSSQRNTEQKTQHLLRQIQELQPMVMQAQKRNTEAAQQIEELMELHQDIRILQDSSQHQPRAVDRRTVHEMIPSEQVRLGHHSRTSTLD